MSLRLPDSGAETTPDGRRHAPSAARNADAILDVLRREAPATGRLLEIASGTGQHAALFAAPLPGLVWQPTDLSTANLTSISAWASHSAAPNLRPPVVLDATRPDGSKDFGAVDAVLLVNLLHLLSAHAVQTLLAEAAQALAPKGVALFYGPFLRDGQATSDGDAAFDASLRVQDPTIGYKDLAWVTALLTGAGLRVAVHSMPANNVMLVARR